MAKANKFSKNLTVNMEGTQSSTPSSTELELAHLLSELGLPTSPDEIIEAGEEAIEPGEFEIEAAVNAAETQELVEKHYAESDAVEIADAHALDTPPVTAPKVSRKKLSDEEKEAKLIAKAERAAARAAAKAARPPATPRKLYTSKTERIVDKLGAELGSYTVLTLSDAALTGDALAAKQKETLEILGSAGLKVQNRMTMLLEYVSGKSSNLNEVIKRAITLLKKDGFIKTGEKGNLHLDLLTKPYSSAAARAMGGNTVAALRLFSVIKKTEEGTYVANPESLLLMKLNAMLGL